MQFRLQRCLILSVAAVMALPSLVDAADKKAKRKDLTASAVSFLSKVQLTPPQANRIAKIREKYQPWLEKLQAEMAITPEQAAAKKAAEARAEADKLKGRKRFDFIQDAQKLSDKQKTAIQDYTIMRNRLKQEVREVLTIEQLAVVDKK